MAARFFQRARSESADSFYKASLKEGFRVRLSGKHSAETLASELKA